MLHVKLHNKMYEFPSFKQLFLHVNTQTFSSISKETLYPNRYCILAKASLFKKADKRQNSINKVETKVGVNFIPQNVKPIP